MDMYKKAFTVAAAALFAASAHAQTPVNTSDSASSSGFNSAYWNDDISSRRSSWIPWTSYGYAGAGLGTSFYDNNCTAGFNCDRHDVDGKIFTGGKFSRYFGVELGYVNLGVAHANGGSEKAQGLDAVLVGSIPVGDRFSLLAKAGTIYGWTRTADTVVNPATNGADNGFNWTYGVGAQYDIDRAWAIRADWDRYRFNYHNRADDQVSAWTIDAIYKF